MPTIRLMVRLAAVSAVLVAAAAAQQRAAAPEAGGGWKITDLRYESGGTLGGEFTARQ